MSRLGFATLWLFVFAIPWEKSFLLPGVGTVSRLVGLVAFAVGLLVIAIQRRLIRPMAFHVCMLLFVAWAALGIFWSFDTSKSLARVVTYAQLAAMVWLIWELADTPRRLTALMHAYVLGASIPALSIVANYLAQQSAAVKRYAAWDANPNDLAFTMVLALPLAWHTATTESGWRRWVGVAYLPVGALAITLTGSRGGLVAALVALLIVPATMMRLRARYRLGMVSLIGAAALLVSTYLPERTLERLASTQTEVTEGQLGGRGVIWVAGTEALHLRPVVGTGAGSFPVVVRPRLGYEVTAHNTYLSLLVENGIVGIMLFLSMVASVMWAARTLPVQERRLCWVLMLTLVVGLMPRTWEAQKPTWYVLAMVATQAAILGRSRSSHGESFAVSSAFPARVYPDLAGPPAHERVNSRSDAAVGRADFRAYQPGGR